MGPVLFVLTFLALGVPLAAEDLPAPEDPVLRELLEEAQRQNPELRAAREALRAAEARPAQASALPGPMLGVLYTNDGWSPSIGREDMTTLSLMASQEIPYPGKRRLRRQVAEADAALAQLDVERTALSLASAVRRAYYGLLLARGLAALAEEQRDLWREVQETARVRYASAVGPQQELLRAQVEATRAHALHAQHHAEARARLAELNRLLGREGETPLETPAPLALAREGRSLEAIRAWSESMSPELKAAALAVQREELALALARRGFKPDFALQGAYMNRGRLDPMWQAGVSVSLPSRKRVRAALVEAEARLAASRARVEDLRLRLRAAVERRMALLEAAEQIEATYRDGMLPQGQLAVESGLARYRAGQGSQLAVLEGMVALLEDRTDYLRLLAGHASERARLEEVSLETGMGGLEGLLMHGRTGMGTSAGAKEAMPATGSGSMSTSSTMR